MVDVTEKVTFVNAIRSAPTTETAVKITTRPVVLLKIRAALKDVERSMIRDILATAMTNAKNTKRAAMILMTSVLKPPRHYHYRFITSKIKTKPISTVFPFW